MALISDHRIAGSKHGAVGIGSAQDVVKSSALALLILFASAALYSAMPSARVTTDVQNWLIVRGRVFENVGNHGVGNTSWRAKVEGFCLLGVVIPF